LLIIAILDWGCQAGDTESAPQVIDASDLKPAARLEISLFGQRPTLLMLCAQK
jgi:hypothetical protein